MKRLLPLVFCCLLAGCASTPVAPGTYKDWEGELDSVEIVQRFHLSAYQRILVLPVDASAVQLPGNLNTREALNAIMEDATKHFAEKLQTKLPDRAHLTATTVAGNTDPRHNPGALLLKARFASMQIGSSTARMFSMGFAGGSKITLEGEFIDGASSQVLVRFSKSNSASQGGVVANLNTRVLEDNEDGIIASVGKLLRSFYP